jgi:phosphoribosylformimino-5-aminoimidazole carboxamide ribotide isomerase
MKIIPAIDIRRGRCVRLLRGRKGTETVYRDHPLETALDWQRQGAEILHVVDLDGAFGDDTANLEAVTQIISSSTIPVQVGGGIRTLEHFRRLTDVGATRVVFGTAAVENPALVEDALRVSAERVVVGVDVHQRKVAIRGWESFAVEDPLDFGIRWKQAGVETFVFTDINRDGALEGPNLDATARFAKHVGGGVIASGGVARLDDLRRLRKLEHLGVEAVIVGRALYEGTFTLAEAKAVLKEDAG